MNEVTVFCHEMFGEIRVIDSEGDPWFVAKDVCEAVGFANSRQAISTHCRGVQKLDAPTSSGIQKMSFIPESDVYRLVMGANTREADRFKDWVCGEVLPKIRKTGKYDMEEKELDNFAISQQLIAACQAHLQVLSSENQALKQDVSVKNIALTQKDAELKRCYELIEELKKNVDKQVRCLKAVENGLLGKFSKEELAENLGVCKSMLEKASHVWKHSEVLARAVIEDRKKISMFTAGELIRKCTGEQLEVIERSLTSTDESDIEAGQKLIASITEKIPSKEVIIYLWTVSTYGEDAVENIYEEMLEEGKWRTLFE